ncbi:cytochrome P450 [Jimgerdemannia flammicorona]|uniref:Cytochrome P450 n=1 Tax=Jimgerdemannia flammicorona TaxID=994334 RepID=A0A433Q4Q0_9FUNG|nr:cytochrome P450 [Jimgerdemannia flammicorona]
MKLFSYESSPPILSNQSNFNHHQIRRIDEGARKAGIPTPSSKSFFLGDSLVFKDTTQSHKTFSNLAQELGSVYFLRMFTTPVLVITDPVVAQYVMSTRNYPKGEWVYKPISASANTSMVTVNGHEHRRIRRQVLPAFNIAFLKKQVPMIVDRSLFLMQRLDELVGQKVNLEDWFVKVTADIIGLLGFGYDFRQLETNDQDMKHMIQTMIGQTNSAGSFTTVDPTAFWRRDNFDKVYIAQKKKFHDIALELIRKGREEKEAGETADPERYDARRRDLNILNLLVKTEFRNESDMPLTDQELIDQVVTFIFAGSETSSNTLCLCVGFLSHYPRVFGKLRAEIDAVFDEIPSWADLTFDKVNSIKYLDCFVKEVLRMVPIAPATVREVDADGEVVAGYAVPKGTWLIVAAYAMHHSEEVWTDAEKFWPERSSLMRRGNPRPDGAQGHPYPVPASLRVGHG